MRYAWRGTDKPVRINDCSVSNFTREEPGILTTSFVHKGRNVFGHFLKRGQMGVNLVP